MVRSTVATVKTFWAEDVKKALKRLMVKHGSPEGELEVLLLLIEDEYSQRWKRDPQGGEGAVKWVEQIYDPLTNIVGGNRL